MKRKLRFTIVINASEEGGYHAWSPTLPGCHSQGETLEEAKKNIIEAIKCHYGSMRKEGSRLPQGLEEFVGTVEIPVKR